MSLGQFQITELAKKYTFITQMVCKIPLIFIFAVYQNKILISQFSSKSGWLPCKKNILNRILCSKNIDDFLLSCII